MVLLAFLLIAFPATIDTARAAPGQLSFATARERTGEAQFVARKRRKRETRGDAIPLPERRAPAKAAGWPLPERRTALAADPKPDKSAAKARKPGKQEEAKPAVPLGPPPPPAQWTDAEIRAAEADCTKLLRDLAADYETLPPIREGVCGDPAPIILRGYKSAPDVVLKPMATINCKMTAAIHEWLTKIVQPRAKELLDAAIIRIGNASAYVCRTRYDDPMQRMSQHAFANALDIGEFITAKGERISVLEHWDAGDEKAAFLKDVHAGACQIFGTTLGPEANAAHRNHFHFDMTKRRKGLCDFPPGQRPVAAKEGGGAVIPSAAAPAQPLPEKRAAR